MSSSWLEEDQQRGTTTARNTVGNAGEDGSNSFIRRHASKINLTVRILNFGIACISAAASVYGIAGIKNGSLGIFFVGLYMLIFAIILGVYELMQFMPVEKIVDLYRWNFGFFFDIKGKALYMIFIAFLNFGFLNDDGETSKQHDLSISAGTLLLFMGLVNLVFALAFKGVLKDTLE